MRSNDETAGAGSGGGGGDSEGGRVNVDAAVSLEDLSAFLSDFEPLSPCRSSGRASDARDAEQHVIGPSPVAISISGSKPGQRNIYRDRKRSELLYLQAYSKELERELHRLVARRDHCALTAQPDQFDRTPTRAQVWKALAMRRRHERQRAELENARLRALLNRQLQFAAEMETLTVPRVMTTTRVALDAADATLLQTLIGELDNVYRQTRQVISETGLDHLKQQGQKLRVVEDKNQDFWIEVTDANTLPCEFEAERHSIWRAAVNQYLSHDGVEFRPPVQRADSATIKYRLPYTYNGRPGALSILLAVRSFTEPARQISVWRAVTIGEGSLAGISADETGWAVMHRMEGSSRDLSTFKSFARLVPMMTCNAAKDKSTGESPSMTTFLEFVRMLVQSSVDDNVVMAQQREILPVP